MTPLNQPRFAGNSVYPVGSITLTTKIKGKGISLPINFFVVVIPLPYNIIMGRPTLNKIKVKILVYKLLTQFETDEGLVGKV